MSLGLRIERGQIVESNFHDYAIARTKTTSNIETFFNTVRLPDDSSRRTGVAASRIGRGECCIRGNGPPHPLAAIREAFGRGDRGVPTW